MKGFCIAIQPMYCKLEGLDRLSYCIATHLGVLQWEQQVGWKGVAIHYEVYCDLEARHCIAEAVEVCCNTNTVLQAGRLVGWEENCIAMQFTVLRLKRA